MIYFLLFLFPILILGCDRGLTQLRHRQSLEFIRCVPTLPGQADPCVVQTGGLMAFCQKDGEDYTCCGTQEVLIQLLVGRSLYNQYDRPILNFSKYNVAEVVYNSQKLGHQKTIEDMEFMKKQFVASPTPRTTQSRRLNSLVNTPTAYSLLTTPSQQPGNFTSSLRVSSNVAIIKDSGCIIIINTGMPYQQQEILTNLKNAGINPSDVQFVVVTSNQPQFIGNLNLFPEAQIIVDNHFIYKEHLVRSDIEKEVRVEICSPNTYIIATPTSTESSISLVAKNIPSLGTVSITGSLFTKETEVSDKTQLHSRSLILCDTDWVVPANSAAFRVTSFQKDLYNCTI